MPLTFSEFFSRRLEKGFHKELWVICFFSHIRLLMLVSVFEGKLQYQGLYGMQLHKF